jgi:protein TonB
MGYQALLFCPDEKLARVVTQVFSELDFKVEPVNEPFAAVKKLMAQRYDAIVVDCENEPNATLLFKSARNSGSNQSSLALALVEGQSGVAKAYRIGANLVLTKPINVEQAKGTLRVARGLLRKNLDAAAPAAPTPAKTAEVAANPFKPASSIIGTVPAGSAYEPSVFESALPAMAASTEAKASPIAAVPEVRKTVFTESSAPASSQARVVESPIPAAATLFKNSGSTSASSSGAASAPAPAKEISPAPVEKKAVIATVEREEASFPTFGATIPGSSPSFGAFEDEAAEGSGSNKKILIAAAVILLVGALAYFGLGSGKTSSISQQPATATVTTPSAPAPASVPPVITSEPRGSVSQPIAPQSTKPSASITASPVTYSDDEPEVVTKKTAPAIVVKSYNIAKKSQTQVDDSASQLPSPLAVASPNDKNLSGLVASVPTALPKATLGTVKISQGVSQGLLIKRVQPRYPQNALAMRVQGSVQLQATINKEGNISNLKTISGDAILARAAAEAVKQWRYKPYYLNGEPVDIETQITVNFKLPN